MKREQLTEAEAKVIAHQVMSDLIPEVKRLLQDSGIGCVYTIPLSKFVGPYLEASIDQYLAHYGDPSRERPEELLPPSRRPVAETAPKRGRVAQWLHEA